MRVLAWAAVLILATGAKSQEPVEYHVRSEGSEWVVSIGARLDPAKGAPSFALSGWGGWRAVDGLYLEVFEARPPVAPDSPAGGPYVLVPPKDWDGDVWFRYTVRLAPLGSEVQQRIGLLPTRAKDYAIGWSWNTLMRLLQGKETVEGRAKISFGQGAVTGWTGHDRWGATAWFDPSKNGPIVFGTPVESAYGKNIEGLPVRRGRARGEARAGRPYPRLARLREGPWPPRAEARSCVHHRQPGWRHGQPPWPSRGKCRQRRRGNIRAPHRARAPARLARSHA